MEEKERGKQGKYEEYEEELILIYGDIGYSPCSKCPLRGLCGR